MNNNGLFDWVGGALFWACSTPSSAIFSPWFYLRKNEIITENIATVWCIDSEDRKVRASVCLLWKVSHEATNQNSTFHCAKYNTVSDWVFLRYCTIHVGTCRCRESLLPFSATFILRQHFSFLQSAAPIMKCHNSQPVHNFFTSESMFLIHKLLGKDEVSLTN